MDSLLLEVVQSIDDFDLRPSQSVQLGDHKDVPFAEDGQAGTELVPLVQGCGAADPFRKDLFATCVFQFLDLGIQPLLLMGRGCPPVSDFSSHRSERVLVSEKIVET